MRVFLAESGGQWKMWYTRTKYSYKGIYLLQSFFYASEFSEKVLIPQSGDYLLDSGAFTFMQNNKFTVKTVYETAVVPITALVAKKTRQYEQK